MQVQGVKRRVFRVDSVGRILELETEYFRPFVYSVITSPLNLSLWTSGDRHELRFVGKWASKEASLGWWSNQISAPRIQPDESIDLHDIGLVSRLVSLAAINGRKVADLTVGLLDYSVLVRSDDLKRQVLPG